MWTTVLFDLDGTLTDSGEGITKCVQYALEKVFGIRTENLHDLDCFIGPPLKEQFMSYANASEADAAKAVAVYRERYGKTGIFENRLYDGIPALLEALKSEHFTLAVASSKPTVYCRRILKHFGIDKYFSVTVGSEMSGERTKKSEVIKEALRLLGMEEDPEEAVLVGDRNYDVIGAKDAGIDCIGVTYGYGSRRELEQVWPACIVDSTTELRNVLIGQLQSAIWNASASGWQNPGGPGTGYCDQNMYGQTQNGYGQNPNGYGQTHNPYGPAPYGQAPHTYGQSPYRYAGTQAWQAQYGNPVRQNPYPAGSGRRKDPVPLAIWRVIYPYLISQGMGVALSLIFGAVLLFLGNTPGAWSLRNFLLDDTAFGGLTDALCLICFVPLFLADERKRRQIRGKGSLLIRKEYRWYHVVMTAVGAETVALLVNILVSSVVYSVNPGYTDPQAGFFKTGIALQFLVIGVIAPICEEFMFRGLTYRRIRDYLGPKWAIFLSALFFGLVHQDLPTDIIVFFCGLFMALAYEHFGTLRASVTVHITINCVSLILNNFGDSISQKAYAAFLAVLFVCGAASCWYLFRRDRKVNAV